MFWQKSQNALEMMRENLIKRFKKSVSENIGVFFLLLYTQYESLTQSMLFKLQNMHRNETMWV